MKVLYIIDQVKCGGIETQLFSTVKELKRAGHTPIALIMSSAGEFYNDFLQAGIRTISITNRTKDIGFFKPNIIRKVRSIIRREDPDIVHMHDIVSGHIGRIACIGLKKPTIYHLHSVTQHGKAKYRISAKILSYVTTLFISVSKEVAHKRLAHENPAQKPHINLYNAIDEQDFINAPSLPYKSILKNDVPCVITCGRLVKLKNNDILLRSLSLLVQRIPDAHALIIGNGPELNTLIKLANTLNIKSHVTFTGFRKDIPSIFKALAPHNTVLAMPSTIEGFPRTFAEAFYCGIPAVISENVPAKEISGDGALVIPVDAQALADALYTVLSDKKTHHKMQQAALEVSKSLVMPVHIKQLIDIYESVL
ncbi:glycosyltransferase [Desulfobaculum senezii]